MKHIVPARRGQAFGLALISLVLTLFLAACTEATASSTDSTTTSTSSDSNAYTQSGGTASYTSSSYSSSTSDVNAVLVSSSGTLSLDTSTLQKTGDTASEDNSNFYGVNAIVLSKGGSSITLTGSTISSDADGANGVFAYQSGSSITLSNCTITTTGDSSRGVDATYGGTVSISDSTISTAGAHCAALASDRYDSTAPSIIADNVTGTTAGDGSPGIYCTGTFTITNSNLSASGSEAAAIEGLNSITLSNSAISGSKKWGVIIYQSMSGDSQVGTGTFTMTGGSLTNKASAGPLFVVCNTEAVINLNGVTLDNASTTLIRATSASSGDSNINSSWGSAGGDLTFNATNQALDGLVSCNSASSIALVLSGTSTWTGTTYIQSGGSVSLNLASTSAWTASADTTLSSLDDTDSSYGNIYAASGITICVGSATAASHSGAVSLKASSSSTSADGGTLYY